jgi:hypothetical protein
MNMNKVMLATLVATAVAMAFAVMPALIQQQASADPAPKTVERCSEEKFAERTSCPGESEDARGNPGDRTDECIARNNGQAKQNDCEETAIVNP